MASGIKSWLSRIELDYKDIDTNSVLVFFYDLISS
jgi:hypothetical protein